MNRIERPDLVINLGDVIEDESRARDLEEYGKFVAILAKLEARVVHVAGNHDQVNLSDDDLRALWGHTGELHYHFDLGGFRFVVLRTIEHKDTVIRLPQEQIDFTKEVLAASPLPAIVLMHHPASDQDSRAIAGSSEHRTSAGSPSGRRCDACSRIPAKCAPCSTVTCTGTTWT